MVLRFWPFTAEAGGLLGVGPEMSASWSSSPGEPACESQGEDDESLPKTLRSQSGE